MEQDAREVLAQLADRQPPPLGFTATDVATRARGQIRKRRIGTALAGAACVAGLCVATETAFGPGGGQAHQGPVSVATESAQQRECAAEIASHIDGPMNKAMAAIGVQACPVLKEMTAILDPQGRHLRAIDAGLQPQPLDVINGTAGTPSVAIASALAEMSWTPDGHYPTTSADPTHELGPFADVWISFNAPGHPDPTSLPETATAGPSPTTLPPPWQKPTVTKLLDGSTVWVTTEHDSSGAHLYARRTLPSGTSLTLSVALTAAIPGNATMTLPYTPAQAVAAVSVAGLDQVVLPPPAE